MQLSRRILTAGAVFSLMAGVIGAADLPRKSPDLSISLTDGKQIHVSQYSGKVVAVCFILTTCPHCQKTIGALSKLQNELGPKGFQVVASAIQQGAAAAVPGFIKNFNPPFPVGFNDPNTAISYMQHPAMLIPHMPLLAFVDKHGMIRAQYEGDDTKFFSDQLDQNLRKQIEALLQEGAAPARNTSPKKASPPKKST